MALAGGLSAQFGMAMETTFGTAVTPTRFLEFNMDTVKHSIERIDSMGLRPNRRVLREKQWLAAREAVSGDVEFDVNTNGFGLLFQAMLGSGESKQPNAGSFPTVYQQNHKVGQIDGKSFTAQIAMGDSGGVVRALTWAGGKIVKWELACDEKGFLKLKPTFDFVSESSVTGLAAAAYAATAVPLAYTGGVIKIGGAEQPTKKFSLVGDTKQKVDRYFMRGQNPQQKKEQLEEGLRAYTGLLTVELENLELYKKFTEGSIAEVTAAFKGPLIAGTYSNEVLVTLPAVRFDGETPAVPGDQLIDVAVPFAALDNGGGTGGVELQYTTTDTAL